jgi:hypothetical protein
MRNLHIGSRVSIALLRSVSPMIQNKEENSLGKFLGFCVIEEE